MALEKHIVLAILDLLAAEHIPAIRYNTGAFKIGNRFIKAHGAGPGHPDIIMFKPFAFIEAKTVDGIQSPEQKTFQAWAESFGLCYLLIRSSDELLEWLREHRCN